MLDKYKEGQVVAYQIMLNAINNNNISHAYLFDSNGNPDVNDIVLSFIKEIVSLDYNDTDDLFKIFQRIDNGNYMDVVIIEPDGIWIRKNQIVDLQNEFSKKSIEGKRKIYVINAAEKMNIQTANSLLKFLEDPVDDIVAILIVNNINLILPTIISRCQVIKLNKKAYSESSNTNFCYLFGNNGNFNLEDNKICDIINNVINFIIFVERNGVDSIIYTKKVWHSFFRDRGDNIMAIELMLNFYHDVIKHMVGKDNLFYKDKMIYIIEVAKINSINSVSKKIVILDNIKNDLRGNMNIILLIDKMIIDMCGDKIESCRN